jgi:hypothetical protein
MQYRLRTLVRFPSHGWCGKFHRFSFLNLDFRYVFKLNHGRLRLGSFNLL